MNYIIIVCFLSGPTETILTGTSVSVPSSKKINLPSILCSPGLPVLTLSFTLRKYLIMLKYTKCNIFEIFSIQYFSSLNREMC